MNDLIGSTDLSNVYDQRNSGAVCELWFEQLKIEMPLLLLQFWGLNAVDAINQQINYSTNITASCIFICNVQFEIVKFDLLGSWSDRTKNIKYF